MTTEWVSPAIAGVFGTASLIAVAIIGARSTSRTNRSTHEPDVNDSWKQAANATRAFFLGQDRFYTVKGGYKGYARRMQIAHGEEGAALTDSEREVLTLEYPVIEQKEGDK